MTPIFIIFFFFFFNNIILQYRCTSARKLEQINFTSSPVRLLSSSPSTRCYYYPHGVYSPKYKSYNIKYPCQAPSVSVSFETVARKSSTYYYFYCCYYGGEGVCSREISRRYNGRMGGDGETKKNGISKFSYNGFRAYRGCSRLAGRCSRRGTA